MCELSAFDTTEFMDSDSKNHAPKWIEVVIKMKKDKKQKWFGKLNGIFFFFC